MAGCEADLRRFCAGRTRRRATPGRDRALRPRAPLQCQRPPRRRVVFAERVAEVIDGRCEGRARVFGPIALAQGIGERQLRQAGPARPRVTPASIRRAMFGWREPGEDAALALEALATCAADQETLSSLTATCAGIAAVAAMRQPDAAHPALADRPFQRVRAQRLSGEARADVGVDRCRAGAAGGESARAGSPRGRRAWPRGRRRDRARASPATRATLPARRRRDPAPRRAVRSAGASVSSSESGS